MNKLILKVGENTREGFLEEVISELPGNRRRYLAGWRGGGSSWRHFQC